MTTSDDTYEPVVDDVATAAHEARFDFDPNNDDDMATLDLAIKIADQIRRTFPRHPGAPDWASDDLGGMAALVVDDVDYDRPDVDVAARIAFGLLILED